MASEAQRLIGISLTKIAQSRAHRAGVSLHKNLLVATVLQKARYMFMEEAYQMVHLQAAQAAIEEKDDSCIKCQEKENQPPKVYLDLDKKPSLKRRRAVAEWETEEAVQSILPKKTKTTEEEEEEEEEVFVDDATILSGLVSVEKAVEEEEEEEEISGGVVGGMEIDRITSLVSIFSFGVSGGEKLNRSVSHPDLCAAQAKEASPELQQRQFLAMTV